MSATLCISLFHGLVAASGASFADILCTRSGRTILKDENTFVSHSYVLFHARVPVLLHRKLGDEYLGSRIAPHQAMGYLSREQSGFLMFSLQNDTTEISDASKRAADLAGRSKPYKKARRRGLVLRKCNNVPESMQRIF